MYIDRLRLGSGISASGTGGYEQTKKNLRDGSDTEIHTHAQPLVSNRQKWQISSA